MSSRWLDATKTATAFLQRFGGESVFDAAEAAARILRAPYELSPARRSAIDLDLIARAVGISINEVDEFNRYGEAWLVPHRNTFEIFVLRSGSDARRRFSIAHELAHTLFYEVENGRIRHRIGLLSRRELRAEEAICDAVAAALLVPQHSLAELGEEFPTAWEALHSVDVIARRLRVSVTTVVRRMSALRWPRVMAIDLQFLRNYKTGKDRKLRVVCATACARGDELYRVWRNQSAESVGLNRAMALFAKASDAKLNVGTYTLRDSGELCRPTREEPDAEEVLATAELADAKWIASSRAWRTASALYTRRRDADRGDTHVLVAGIPL